MATATLEQQLDALLIWLGNPENPNVAVLDEAIARTGLTRLEAAGRAYDILDRFLFAGPSGSPEQILGLRDTADVATAKQRYRCLIQAYHPDRHPARVLVHTERTEQINIAYAAFERTARESASRGTVAPGPVSTRRTPRARRRRPPKQADSYPLGAAPSRQSLGARLRRSLGGAESFQARFFAGLILLCALLLASLLYPEPSPHRVSAGLDASALPSSEARLDGVERPETPSATAELRLDAPPTAIAPIPPSMPAAPLAVVSLAEIRAEPIESSTPDAQMPLPAPLIPPAPEPVVESVAEAIRAPVPAPLPERKTALLLPAVQAPPGLSALPPPLLLGQARSDTAERPGAPALPARIAPIRPVHALERTPAPDRSSETSYHRSIDEVDATKRAPSVTSVIAPVATAKKTEDPASTAATEMGRPADPPASPAVPATARAKASADAADEPLRKRPPAVEERASLAAAKPPHAAGMAPGGPSVTGRSSSPTPESSKTSDSSKEGGCEPIAGALDRFRRAYNAGALDRLMALYRTDAQENETRGQSGIRQLYIRWFDQTSDRRIAFSGARIHPDGEGRCSARAGFSVRYRDARGHRVDRSGTIDILFDGRGADARILRILY